METVTVVTYYTAAALQFHRPDQDCRRSRAQRSSILVEGLRRHHHRHRGGLAILRVRVGMVMMLEVGGAVGLHHRLRQGE